jgi:hypothetical protein
VAELGVAAGEERDRAEAGERGTRGIQFAQRRPAQTLVPQKSSVIQPGHRFLVWRAQPLQARQRGLVGATGRARAARGGVDEPLHPGRGGGSGPAAARAGQFGERREHATAKKIAADLKAGNDNAAGALATGQYGWGGALSHGQSFESVVTQKPGYWVIACFMDTQDGREHTTLGMEKVIQILK